jgi:hypothetical protein
LAKKGKFTRRLFAVRVTSRRVAEQTRRYDTKHFTIIVCVSLSQKLVVGFLPGN